MAVDTRDRRAAVLGWGLLPLVLAPVPDTTISEDDRAHLVALYPGLQAVTGTAERGVVLEATGTGLIEAASETLAEAVAAALRE